MAKDVLVTPASGLVDFLDSGGNSDASIQLDDAGNLNITNPGGQLSLGDTGSDVYIGDGTTQVDMYFEQSGNIFPAVGTTLGIGQAGATVALAGTISGFTVSGTLAATNFSGISGGTF